MPSHFYLKEARPQQHGTTDKWGTIGNEKASTQLADTLDQQTEKIRKRVKIGGKILRFGKH